MLSENITEYSRENVYETEKEVRKEKDTKSLHADLSRKKKIKVVKDKKAKEKLHLSSGASTSRWTIKQVAPVIPELFQLRIRSRRSSGVQSDLSLTQEELSVTPAETARKRSLSRDRETPHNAILS